MATDGEASPAPRLTPAQVLGWIAASTATAWYPSQFSASAGISRDSLDEPLHELRGAELIRIVDWVRGVGQGYAVTPDGKAALLGSSREQPAVATIAVPTKPEPRAVDLVEFRTPIVAPALLLANLLWYAIGAIVAVRAGASLKNSLLHGDLDTFSRMGAVSAAGLLRGEWWRLATCCFVHGSIWHLMLNMVNLGMVGAFAEVLWGRWRVFVIYAIAGLAGSCLTLALAPSAILVGASGAIWGLATSIAAWMLIIRRRLRRDVARELARRLTFGFALGIGVSLLPGVGWQAHLGGAIAGFATALLLYAARFTGRAEWAFATTICLLVPALCLGGLHRAMQSSPAWERFRHRSPTNDSDPTPLVVALNPAAVTPVVNDARYLLMVTPSKRSPERLAAVRGEVASFWGKAVEASKRLVPVPGPPELTANRAKAKAFADARVSELSRLLGMLDAKAIPDVETWRSWGQSQRDADRLWHELEK